MSDLYNFDYQLLVAGAGAGKFGGILAAGIDEAGRGPLAGPVVAASVILSYSKEIEGINDSKKLSEKKRESLFWDIVCSAIAIGVGIIGPEVIDEINILNASKLAMVRAVEDLRIKPSILLIDALTLQITGYKQIPIIKGDAKSACIAAASIIAKVTRDCIMKAYDTQYPQYGFSSHKGYGTKVHMDNLRKFGPCAIHRKTFAPVMNCY
ncbi:MAG: ribonuclease HII [Nitrospirae bacterium]|nr:ribonuclease HII [Nitrospirota bacterium]